LLSTTGQVRASERCCQYQQVHRPRIQITAWLGAVKEQVVRDYMKKDNRRRHLAPMVPNNDEHPKPSCRTAGSITGTFAADPSVFVSPTWLRHIPFFGTRGRRFKSSLPDQFQILRSSTS